MTIKLINCKLTHGRELEASQLPNELLVLIKSFFLGNYFEWKVTVSTLCYVWLPMVIILTITICRTQFLSGFDNHFNKTTEGEVPVLVYEERSVMRINELIVIGRN